MKHDGNLTGLQTVHNFGATFQPRNLLYAKWLGSGRVSDRQKFVNAQQDTRKAVRSAKDA